MTISIRMFSACLAVGLSSHVFAAPLSLAGIPKTAVAPQSAGLARHVDGLQALERGDLASAERAFLESMRLNPLAHHPLLGMADLALRKKETSAAWGWLEKALKLAPQSGQVHHAIGRYYFANGENSKAIDALKRAQKLQPDSALIFIDQGEIYAQALGRHDLATLAYRSALLIDPQHAGAHYGLGSALLASGKSKEAEAELLRAATLAPDNPLPSLSLGKLYASLGQAADAAGAFDSALKIRRDLVPALLGRGDLYLSKKNLNEALAMFQRAAKWAPENWLVQLKLGQAYQGLTRMGEAETAYLAALRLKPDFALVYNNLAWLRLEDKKDLVQAEQWAKKATQLAPQVSSFLDTLAWVYRAQDKTDAAAAMLEKASKMRPRSAEILYHLGIAYLEQKKPHEAKKAFRESLSVQGDYQPARQALAKL